MAAASPHFLQDLVRMAQSSSLMSKSQVVSNPSKLAENSVYMRKILRERFDKKQIDSDAEHKQIDVCLAQFFIAKMQYKNNAEIIEKFFNLGVEYFIRSGNLIDVDALKKAVYKYLLATGEPEKKIYVDDVAKVAHFGYVSNGDTEETVLLAAQVKHNELNNSPKTKSLIANPHLQ